MNFSKMLNQNPNKSVFYGSIALYISIFVCWALFVLLSFFSNDIPLAFDGTFYMALAENLLHGRGFSNAAVPFPDKLMRVPLVFPAFLTLYWLFFAPNIAVFKIFIYAIVITGCFPIYKFLKQAGLGFMAAYAGIISFSAMPLFSKLPNEILSELLFVPLLYAGAYCSLRFYKEKTDISGWMAVTALILLSHTRFLGVFFAGSYAVWFFLQKNRIKSIAIIFGYCTLLALEYLVAGHGPKEDGYLSVQLSVRGFGTDALQAFSAVFYLYMHNIRAFVSSMYAKIVFPYFYGLFSMNYLKLSAVLLLDFWSFWGLALLWKKNAPLRPFIIGFILSFLPIMTWDNSISMYRYFFPFFPIFFVIAILPAEFLIKGKTHKLLRAVPAIIAVIIAFNQIVDFFREKPLMAKAVSFGKEYRDFHRQIVKIPDKPDIIISNTPHYTYFSTGIYSIPYEYLDRYKEHLLRFSMWAIDSTSFPGYNTNTNTVLTCEREVLSLPDNMRICKTKIR